VKYTVVWLAVALDELARLYNDAPNRELVTAASNRIDRLLSRDPEEVGESRSNGRRILLEAPLGVIYTVRADDRLVEVGYVWAFQTR